MKITAKQLKQIIREEVANLSEDSESSGSIPSLERMELTKAIHNAMELCDRIARMSGGSKAKNPAAAKCEKHLLAAWEAIKS